MPEIFSSPMLVNSCVNGKLGLVQQILENNTEPPSEVHIRDNKNALDIAMIQLNDKDKNSYEIARICTQYANSLSLGLKMMQELELFPKKQYSSWQKHLLIK